MIDPISIISLITSTLIPWIFGAVWVYCLLHQTNHLNGFIVAGHGYFIGIFFTTLLIRLLDFAGLPLHFWLLNTIIICLTLAGIFILRALPHKSYVILAPENKATKTTRLKVWQLSVLTILLAMIFYRYSTLSQELFLRPLFPWDSWMNWAPKAIVWFHMNDLVQYVSPEEWLAATNTMPNSTLSFTLGNPPAWKYPISIPLIQLWGMLSVGSSDQPLIYLPWLLVTLSLSLALYGHLRLSGSSILTAVVVCYLFLNLPYLNVHTTLTGYADLWLAATFGLASFSIQEWSRTRHWPYALLTLILAITCTQLKIPGIVLGALVCAVLLLTLIKISVRVLLGLFLVLSLSGVYLMTVGVSFNLSNIGQITISTSNIELPYIGSYELAFYPIHSSFVNTLLVMQNWNLLWYILAFTVAVTFFRAKYIVAPSSATVLTVFATIFVVCTFYFTKHYAAAESFTTINRAILYLIPSIFLTLPKCLERRMIL